MVNRGAVYSIEDSGRGPSAEVSYMPGTSGCFFFTPYKAERGQCAKTVRLGSGRRVGGWEWERGNPGYLGGRMGLGVMCSIKWFYVCCVDRQSFECTYACKRP